MDLLEELKALGVDVTGGVKRLMGNEKLYRKLLGSFAKMAENQSVDPNFDCTDYTETTEKVHALKGTAGNLSITPLYDAYNEMLGLLRNGQPEQAKAVLENVLPVQKDIIDCIKKHMES